MIGYRGRRPRRARDAVPIRTRSRVLVLGVRVARRAARTSPGAAVSVTVAVRNAGRRRSREVVQLYASRPDSGIERPVRWLVGFAAVQADPGQTATATIIVPPRAFEHWSVQAGGWAVEPGMFKLTAGSSSAVLPLSAQIVLA